MEELARLAGRHGELVLRCADDGHHELVSNGMFLMDTRDGRSERGLVTCALDAVAAGRPRAGLTVLVGGLGVGFSVGAALADRRVTDLTVVELEPAVVDLVRDHTGARTGAELADERVRVVVGDLHAYLASAVGTGIVWDVVCIDVDNGPGWTLGAANDRLYTRAGVALLDAAVAPGGVAAVWSAHDVPRFVALLADVVGPVTTHTWAVPRGEPDRVWVAARRPRR